MLDRVLEYKWQCASCKSCVKCRKKVHNDKMLFCDQCDRGYHIYCIGLRNVPEGGFGRLTTFPTIYASFCSFCSGRWHCSVCSICTRCGSRSAEGHPNPNLTLQQKQNLLMMAHWTHQYRTNTASKIKEHCQTLCILCAKQQNL
jgi:BRG1-associated factor 45A